MDSLVSLAARASLSVLGAATSPRLSILTFHRVHAVADSIFTLEATATIFRRLMRVIAGSYQVLTLGEAADCLARNALPPRALVITFDDGYADNAEVALPILLEQGLRATFFVATDYLNGGRMWNDSVIENLRLCKKSEIDLSFLGLSIHPLGDAASRRALIEKILPRIKFQPVEQREVAVATLNACCGSPALPSDLMMRNEQVRQLHAAGMEIGAHTARHPVLKTLSPQDAEHEIRRGRDELQTLIDAPVDVFAYPHGKPDVDYDLKHAEMVRKLGFRAAVSTAHGVAQHGADPMQLPRLSLWGRNVTTWASQTVRTRFDTAFVVAQQR